MTPTARVTRLERTNRPLRLAVLGGGVALHGPGGRGGALLYLRRDGALAFDDSTGAVTARFPEP